MIVSYKDLISIPSIENMNSGQLSEIFESCYRKFKSYIYYRSGSSFSETTIAAFESRSGIMEKTFHSMAEAFLTKDDKYFNRLIEKITYKVVVKSISDLDPENNLVFTNKAKNAERTVAKFNFFADFPIELYILDTFWSCIIGKIFSHTTELSLCYGNVLNSKIFADSGIGFDSLSLFEPYFERYQLWETEPVKKAEQLYDSHEDSTLISLDVTRFYYSVDLNFNDLFSIFSFYDAQYCQFQWFHLLEERIYRFYSSCLGEVDFSIGKKIVLPLGLPSACILSNYYLSDVDRAFLTLPDYAFYGRYVDDMILVLRGIRPEEKSFDDLVSGRLSSLFFKSDSGYSFRIRESLTVQKEKTRIFKTLVGGPKTTLEKLKKQGFAASEPQLVPENEFSYENFIRSVYPEKDSLKIRDTEPIVLNFRALSSLVSNYLLFEKKGGIVPSRSESEPENVEKRKKEREQWSKFFKTENLLAFCLKWKPILLFASVFDDHAIYQDVVDSLAKSISEIDIDKSLMGFDSKKLKNILKKDMNDLLILGEASAAAINGFVLQSKYSLKIQKLSQWLFNANMINHSALAFPLASYLENTQAGQDYRNCTLRSLLTGQHKKLINRRLRYSPRYIHFGEYCIFKSFLAVENVNKTNFLRNLFSSYRDDTEKIFGVFECPESRVFSKGGKPIVEIALPTNKYFKKEKFSSKHVIGMANINAELDKITRTVASKGEWDDDKCYVYSGFTTEYIKTLRRLIRESRNIARDKSWIFEDGDSETEDKRSESLDFIVFPELSIPIEWASILEQFSRSSGIGVVAGLISEPSDDHKFLTTSLPLCLTKIPLDIGVLCR